LADHPDHENDVQRKLQMILAPFQERLINDELIAEMTAQLNEKLASELGQRCIGIERESGALKAKVISEALFEEAAGVREAICYDAVKSALAA
jgi:hypothetical protein